MHVQTDIYIYIYIYTNIAESRIERDYWPRYAHAARQQPSLSESAVREGGRRGEGADVGVSACSTMPCDAHLDQY